jgi:tetratricopeptide (TPR) repeat protein
MRFTTFALLALLAAPPMTVAQPPQRTDPNIERAQTHYKLGWESLRSEAWDAAVKEFQQAIDLYPKFTLAYYGLGKAHMGLRRYPAAAQAFETCKEFYVVRAGEKFSGQFDAQRARQDRMMELQDLSKQFSKGPQTASVQDAQRQIQNAIRQTQSDTERGANVNIDASVPAFVSLALGSAYFRAERMADAEREYKAAIDADSSAGEAHNNLAVVYMLTGRFDESTREITAAEKSGFKVNPQFKKDLDEKRKATAKGR